MPSTPVSEGVRKVPKPGLAGLRVILTRPRHQCDPLIAMLEERGAEARCVPVIVIEPPSDSAPALTALNHILSFDIAVFTSANAVSGALSLAPKLAADIVDRPVVAAVGPATRNALERAGIHVSISPDEDFSSEGLLRHPRLKASAVRGKEVLIVKGAGGRGLLEQVLAGAGAAVTSVDVYRRSRPEGRISELLGEPLTGFDLIVLTSGTAIEYLLDISSDTERRQIIDSPMVAASARIARIARNLGVTRSVHVAAGPDDEALVAAVECWRDIRAEKSQ